MWGVESGAMFVAQVGRESMCSRDIYQKIM